jgi:hypothetical protein
MVEKLDEAPQKALVGLADQGQVGDVTDLGHLDSEPVPPTNDMALVSFLAGIGGWILGGLGLCPFLQAFSLCLAPLAFAAWSGALISGFVARGQIAESQEAGNDLAIWGMAAGGTGLLLGILIALVAAALFVLLGIRQF